MAPERIPRQRVGRYPLDVFRVDAGSNHFIRTLEASYGGLFTHYVGRANGRSHYCPDAHCSCQHSKLDRVWKGYTSVEVWDPKNAHWFPAILEITEALEVCFRGRFDRGQVWELSRRAPDKEKKSYPVVGRFVEDLKEEHLPSKLDYRPVLMRLYHAPDGVQTHHKNPMPMPELVEPSKGKPPTGFVPNVQASNPERNETVNRLRREAEEQASKPTNGNGHHAPPVVPSSNPAENETIRRLAREAAARMQLPADGNGKKGGVH